MGLVAMSTGPGNGEDAAMEDGNEGEQSAAKQTAKKKRPPKKTVEQNLANINRSESEMKCEVSRVGTWVASRGTYDDMKCHKSEGSSDMISKGF